MKFVVVVFISYDDDEEIIILVKIMEELIYVKNESDRKIMMYFMISVAWENRGRGKHEGDGILKMSLGKLHSTTINED